MRQGKGEFAKLPVVKGLDIADVIRAAEEGSHGVGTMSCVVNVIPQLHIQPDLPVHGAVKHRGSRGSICSQTPIPVHTGIYEVAVSPVCSPHPN